MAVLFKPMHFLQYGRIFVYLWIETQNRNGCRVILWYLWYCFCSGGKRLQLKRTATARQVRIERDPRSFFSLHAVVIPCLIGYILE